MTELFKRRLLVVVGKGGVGKTTVATALALEAARGGARTLLAEVDGVGRAARLFGVSQIAPGQAQQIGGNLYLMDIEGRAALDEYLMMIVPVKRAIQAVLESRIYQYFVAAAPGLRELMTVGKIWYEAERTGGEAGERLWDLVVVDAPATGHSLQYLSMPQAAYDTFTAGLVHREAQRVVEVLRDPRRTGIVFVTTAEEMPVNETIEMHRRVRDELKLPSALLVANRVHQPGVRPEDAARLARGIDGAAGKKHHAFFEEALRRAREEVGWIAINARYLARLRDAIDLPMVVLPMLYTEEFGLAEVRGLGVMMHGAAHGMAAAEASG